MVFIAGFLAIFLSFFNPQYVSIKVGKNHCFIPYEDGCVISSDGYLQLEIKNETSEKMENLSFLEEHPHIEFDNKTFNLAPNEEKSITLDYHLADNINSQTLDFTLILTKNSGEKIREIPQRIKVVKPNIRLKSEDPSLSALEGFVIALCPQCFPSCSKDLQIHVSNPEKNFSYEKVLLEVSTGTNDVIIIHPKGEEKKGEHNTQKIFDLGKIAPLEGTSREITLKALEDKTANAKVEMGVYWVPKPSKKVLLQKTEYLFYYSNCGEK